MFLKKINLKTVRNREHFSVKVTESETELFATDRKLLVKKTKRVEISKFILPTSMKFFLFFFLVSRSQRLLKQTNTHAFNLIHTLVASVV